MLDLENMPVVALPHEVAELCRVDVATVRRWVRSRKLEALSTGRGGALRITGASVLRLFGRQQQSSHLGAFHRNRELAAAGQRGHNAIGAGRGGRRDD